VKMHLRALGMALLAAGALTTPTAAARDARPTWSRRPEGERPRNQRPRVRPEAARGGRLNRTRGR
jgi:hypothetical protein